MVLDGAPEQAACSQVALELCVGKKVVGGWVGQIIARTARQKSRTIRLVSVGLSRSPTLYFVLRLV